VPGSPFSIADRGPRYNGNGRKSADFDAFLDRRLREPALQGKWLCDIRLPPKWTIDGDGTKMGPLMALTPAQLEPLTRMKLKRPPVAVAFLPTPPAGLPRIDGPLPAGCGYWKHASDGHAFYTRPEDHENCAVGAFTHGVTLSAERSKELESLVGTMIQLHYLRSEEVAEIPRRQSAMEVVAYAPIADATFEPDAVIFRGNARQVMLISEAARSAGIYESGAAMGRPACAMIPQASAAASGVASVGCIGNRVYTGLGDDELYFSVPGGSLPRVLEQLDVMLTANSTLEAFHRERAAMLGS
jgi:uncharacterized protein (DUF169 family)